MTRLTASKAREEFADTLNRVAFGKERIVLHRRGKDLVALIPAEELRAVEKVLDALEDRLDLEDAEAALADPRNKKTIPWDEIKRGLGL
jgi:prevent-host-death family protein